MLAPSGTVTFLFTDVEGSTALWRDVPASMEQALELHDGLLRSVIDRFGGYVFTTAGDSFAVAFSRADAGLRCAIEIQRELSAAAWPHEAPLRIRMGVHSGEAVERDGDFFGPAVNVAARVMGLAAGGQVLVSTATRAILADSLRNELTLRDLGEHELRGIGGPERLFQVEATGLDRDFPQLPDVASAGNLPTEKEALIGRDRDIELVRRLLEESRLCTIVGVGGIGKTRLALSTAAGLSGQWDDGAWLVELAPVGDGASLPQAVADAIGCRQHVGLSLTESVVEFFRRRKALVVLDNCEHLVDDAAEFVEALLARAPGVHVLATSREALGLLAERSYPLPSLATGGPGSASEELFLRRAAQVAPHRTWDNNQLAAIDQICERLDGIPLAIELAASRCRSLTPVDIAPRLDHAFLAMRGGRRSVERHRTLKAAIDWSHDTLDGDEQTVFARLSVFAGGCDLAGAEAVASGEGVDPVDVFDLLDSLVSQSLVVTGVGAGGQTRYRMLEPVRQYAEDRLAHRNESAAARDAHLDWVVSWTRDWNRWLPVDDRSWRDSLDENIANIRTAVEWACEHRRADQLLTILEDLSPATPLLQRFELGHWAERSLELPEVQEHPCVAAAYAVAASSAWWRGDTDQGADLASKTRLAAKSDEKMFYPAAVDSTALRLSGEVRGAVERLLKAEPRGDTEVAIQQFLLCGHVAAKDPDEFALSVQADALGILDEMAKRTGSSLPQAAYHNHTSRMALAAGAVDEGIAAAQLTVEAAVRIGLTRFVRFGAMNLASGSDATGVITPRNASAAATVLRDLSDSGAHLDQWQLLGPLAYPLWRLGHQSLSAAIRRGYGETVWAKLDTLRPPDLTGERAIFEREPVDQDGADLSQSDLVEAVLNVLNELAG